MDLNIFNTLSRKKEKFEPINNKTVSLYTCGPTVYNYPHIGNYRAYIFADILKRYLIYKGFQVNHVMNITDVDDKTIRDSQKDGKTLKDFTEFYTKGFFEDRDSLNILEASKYTKATDYIDEMISMIEKLLEKGFAYKGEDGSIYFDIRKDAGYGKLSHFNLEDLKENADGRLKKDEYEKENAQDFALWKAWDASDSDVFWETSLGKGRPGWHIECSAMSIKELGESIDIHTGGVDLIFPHHENEIAQSECATGKNFAKYFMHNEHLMVDGKKMAKSAGNFYTLRDLESKGFSPLSFRLAMYSAHYRSKLNFTLESLEASSNALEKLYTSYKNIVGVDTGIVDIGYKERLMEYMDDDLDTPKALALLWDLVHNTTISDSNKKATLLDFDKVFGFGLADIKEEIIPDEILSLTKEREQARIDKDWARSDELRDKIKSLGYEVKDTDSGYKISKI